MSWFSGEQTADRPRFLPPFSSLDRTLIFLTIAILLYQAFYFYSLELDPSMRIPMRFNLQGDPIAWGSMSTVWFLFYLSAFSGAFMHVVARYPWTHNYSQKITPQNAAAFYALNRSLLVVLAFGFVLGFGLMNLECIDVAMGKKLRLNNFLLLCMVLAPLAALTVYFIKARKIGQLYSNE